MPSNGPSSAPATSRWKASHRIPTAELWRKHGISEAIFYNWRSRYGGMELSDARRLKSLEDENRRLNMLLAESMLDVATLKEWESSDAQDKEGLRRREVIDLNHNKPFRLYQEERPTVKKRGGRKPALGTQAPMALRQGPNHRWSLDFVSDMLADGRRFRVLVVVDDCTRECLALVVDTSQTGMRVARELDAIGETRGRPLMVPDQVRDLRQRH